MQRIDKHSKPAFFENSKTKKIIKNVEKNSNATHSTHTYMMIIIMSLRPFIRSNALIIISNDYEAICFFKIYICTHSNAPNKNLNKTKKMRIEEMEHTKEK